MNSGLQCLSNTMELTKYFLYGFYKLDINSDNPLGLGGRLATAYTSLLEDLWIDKESRTAPYDLKRVLGKRVARFSGYGQQDACELVNYLLDLIHEDLNRVKKKPYVEMPEADGRPDEVISNLYWQAFLARNQSVIVDLMYGQLKSTVRCLTCSNISITFDPFLTLSLPVARVQAFSAALVPFEFYTVVEGKQAEASDDSEEDPDYKAPSLSRIQITEHKVYTLEFGNMTTVLEMKQRVAEKAAVIGKRAILVENLELCFCKFGEIWV